VSVYDSGTLKPYGTRRLKRLIRGIGAMTHAEREAFFDRLGPDSYRDLRNTAIALYESEKTEPGNLHDPWSSDHDLSVGMMILFDRPNP
jgi:hypothetical protein